MEKIEIISQPLSLKNFKIRDSFWEERMELVRKEVIPYQWEILNDRVAEAAPSFCMRNFKIAGKLMKEKKEKGEAFEEPKYTFRGFEALPEDMEHLEDKFYGFVFQDSDFYKWVEAVAYSLVNHPDEKLEKTADAAIEAVCQAQQENGYLDTYYIINGMDQIFTNIRDHHELYCLGHLIEGAAAYYEATGKDRLLQAAERYVDFVISYFGLEEPEKENPLKRAYPGHEIAEMALVRLYEITGKEKYLNLSRHFIDERGTRPNYFFEVERKREDYKKSEEELVKEEQYGQSHLPVREQKEAVGHAVRAVYLYSGMADIAGRTGDNALFQACKELFASMVREKMYVTGAIGATKEGESFLGPFELPNDSAYAETCASIGLVFFARRMLQMEPDHMYADVMEQALYNTVLSGMAMDGKSFFYVNPLKVVPEICKKEKRLDHVKPVRQKWFGCACCPPNISRLLSSLPGYAFTENKDTLWIHLYLGGRIEKMVEGKKALFRITTEYPQDGKISVCYEGEDGVSMTLGIRLPAWSRETKAEILNALDAPCGMGFRLEKGYLYVGGAWEKGTKVRLSVSMEPRLYKADERVKADIGKVAVMCGPFAYCMEEWDNGKNLDELALTAQAVKKGRVWNINGTWFREENVMQDFLFPEAEEGAVEIEKKEIPVLRFPGNRNGKEETLTFIPYYAWANRGENEMQVFTDYQGEAY